MTAATLVFGFAHSASETRSPSSCTSAPGSGSAWTNPAGAISSDDAYASATVDGTTTNYLRCVGYGFTIPAGSRIDGITVMVERKSDRISNGGSRDAAVRVIKGGTIGTADRSTAAMYQTLDFPEPHGGVTDLWGQTWTTADINAANFGAAFAATKPDANGPAHLVTVDDISITVTYTPPPTVSSIDRAGVDPTSAASVDWTVTFSEAVSGVDASDFVLVASGLSGVSITSVIGGPIIYIVTANTGSGSGTLGLNLADNDSIVSVVTSVPLGGVGAGNGDFTGQVYTVNRTVPVASFNAVEPGAHPVNGRVFTKLVGNAISLEIVALDGSGNVSTSFTGIVRVELLNASNNSGALDASNCRPTWTTIQTLLPDLVFTSADNGRKNISFTQPNAYADVRLRMTYPAGVPSVTACSRDNYAVRPLGIAVTSTDATNNGTSGAPAIKTGANFNLTASTGVPGYNGTPAIDNSPGMVIGSPNAGTIGGSFGPADPATGTAIGNSFFYSEVGNFGLAATAVRDMSFTAVDQPNDCTADFSNSLVSGQYGCYFGSAAIAMTPGSSGFGRFIPDNFNVTYNAPAFATFCGAFTYVGQALPYDTAPVMTITARSGTANGLTNTTTRNYAGSYMKLANSTASLNQAPYDSQGGRYSRFDALGGGMTPALDTSALPSTATDPTIGTFSDGVGTLTFASGLAFTRGTVSPSAPFDADIALSLNIVDSDGVVFGTNPARFGQASAGNGIAFTSGKSMRFGRLRLDNAVGSEKLDLPLPIRTEYWNGSAFQTNGDDDCTSLSAANMALGDYTGGINGTNMDSSHISVGGSFSDGFGTLALTKPTPTPSSAGSVTLTVNLTAEGKSYLKGNWGVATYTADPRSRAAFGLYGGQPRQFIYFRENY